MELTAYVNGDCVVQKKWDEFIAPEDLLTELKKVAQLYSGDGDDAVGLACALLVYNHEFYEESDDGKLHIMFNDF